LNLMATSDGYHGRRSAEEIHPHGEASWVRQFYLYIKGGIFDRHKVLGGRDELEHYRNEQVEFPEGELDIARVKVWTTELEQANDQWYKCKRQNGSVSFSACLEEGEYVRKAHWKHQLQIKEAGCEESWFRYAKCLQSMERLVMACRDTEEPFVQCAIKAGNMDLVAQDPGPLQRPSFYSGYIWRDIPQYRNWIRNRNEFLKSHQDWFSEDDVEIMNPKQLYQFISKKEEWVDRGDTKFSSTFAVPQRYQEYVPFKDYNIAPRN